MDGVFRTDRANVGLALLILVFLVLFFIARSRRHPYAYIRRIAGLNAIEEALGRATEMGRPVLYVPGVMDVDRLETIASLAILKEVARESARHGTRLQVPTCYPLAMTAASEVVRAAYQEEGRPDLFRPEDVRFLTDNLFAYAGAVCGIMLRERPAANFFLGEFYAESLILAETGNTTGAIQIAGTGQPTQLPFFIAACDYTLLGEELFAAGAYISRAPVLMGSLKGQDFGKAAIAAAILIGVVCELVGVTAWREWFTVH